VSAPLACGRRPDYLHDLVADELTEGPAAAAAALAPADRAHLDGCPYCAAELATLRRQWARVRAVAEEPVAPPAELVDRTLTTLRAIRGDAGRGSAELAQPGGVLRVRDRVVVRLARALARDLVADYRRSRGLPPGSARVLAVSGGPDGLTVQVALPYGEPAHEVAALLRATLDAALAARLDALAPPVSVEVADVTGPPNG
jgi:hypothetical protein